MAKKVKEVVLLLQMNGWHHVRTREDHRVFRKQGAVRSISVPGKDSDDMPEGLYSAIFREANLK